MSESGSPELRRWVEDKPGVILDYDEHGDLISLEVLDASRRVTDASHVEFQTTG